MGSPSRALLATATRLALALAAAACAPAPPAPSAPLHLASCDAALPWFPSVEAGLPVLEVDARGAVRLEGVAYDLADEGSPSAAAYRTRLVELRGVLGTPREDEHDRSAGDWGRPLVVLADRDAPLASVMSALRPTRYKGIGIAYLALGLHGDDDAPRRLSLYQFCEVSGMVDGTPTSVAWHVPWSPEGSDALLTLRFDVEHAGELTDLRLAEHRFPPEIVERPAVAGEALGDVMRAVVAAGGHSAVRIVRETGASWSDFVQLLDTAWRAGLDQVDDLAFAPFEVR